MFISKSCRFSFLLLLSIFFSYKLSLAQAFLYEANQKKPKLMSQLSLKEQQEAFENYWRGKKVTKGNGYNQFKRYEYFWEERLGQNDAFPNAMAVYQEYEKFKEKAQNTDKPMMIAEWVELGPKGLPKNTLYYKSSGAGRVSCICFHPSDPNTFWIGASTGGVWKTTNFGRTWRTYPFTQFMSIGISDIAVSKKNPNIVYAATGDVNYYYGSGSYSIGIIKTTDDGETWKVTSLNKNLSQQYLVSKILVHPDNPNIIIAATNSGVLKSTDGGEMWNATSTGFFARNMEMMPGNPNVIYLSTYSPGGSVAIYKSQDMGDSWKPVYSFSNVNRVVLSVTPNAPNNVYALASQASTNGFGGMFISEDQGENWEQLTASPNILGRDGNGTDVGGQGNYDLALAVDPYDKDLVFAGGINLWKSTSTGSGWDLSGHWTGSFGADFIHADQHHLVYNPLNGILFSANDGGIYYSTNQGSKWVDISEGLGIMQFYRISCSETDEKMVIGGSQDNGTNLQDNSGWSHVMGGDGMECIIDYTNKNIVYGSYYNGEIMKSRNKGSDFNSFFGSADAGESGAWVTPYIIDPVNPNTIYIGYRNVWKVTGSKENKERISNFGANSALLSLAISKTNHDVIYAANNYNLWRTTNGGNQWDKILTTGTTITYISVDDSDPLHIWVSLSGYDPAKKVYEYVNGEWKNITENLPNVPVNCIISQRNSPNRIFIGTDIGVFFRDDNIKTWTDFNDGLPNIIVRELEIYYPSGKLRAATYGRGLWETKIVNCNIPEPHLTLTGETEFCLGDSLIITAPQAQDNVKYEWSTGDITNFIVVKKSGTYQLTITDENGCVAKSQPVQVKVFDVPDLIIQPIGKYPVCLGDSIRIMVGFGYKELKWSNGESSRIIWVKEPGTYSVWGKTGDGCENISDPFNVEFIAPPEKPTIWQVGPKLLASEASAYQWYFEGELIENATEQEYVIDKLGLYTVRVFNAAGCWAISDPFKVISSADEQDFGTELILKPNPVTDKLMVSFKDNEILNNAISAEITDVLGKVCFNKDYNANTLGSFFEISTSSLSKGVYYLVVRTGKKSYVKRFLKN